MTSDLLGRVMAKTEQIARADPSTSLLCEHCRKPALQWCYCFDGDRMVGRYCWPCSMAEATAQQRRLRSERKGGGW